jgi:hypothetical protein
MSAVDNHEKAEEDLPMEKKPLRVLSLGAGVQSTTTLLMAIHGELPKPDHVVFADVGWEPKPVYEHLAKLEALMVKHDIPFHKVTQGNLKEDFLSQEARNASMPLFVRNDQGKIAMVRRQCTSEYKIKPLMKKQRELAGLKKGQRSKEHLITTVIGISYDESQRMRDAAFPWIRNEYPLVDLKMTRQDCLDWNAEKGYDKPPRSACVGCPFKNQEEWRHLKATMPEEWEDAVAFDQALRKNSRLQIRFNGELYLHRSGLPLDQVDLRTDEEKGIFSLFDMECEGMCGL